MGWWLTLFGMGPIEPIKDRIKLGLDIKGGVYVVLEAETDAIGEELTQIMEQTQAVIENRVNQMGLSEPVVTIEGTNRIRVELPGAEDANEAIDLIGKTAQLEFVLADGTVMLSGNDIKNAGVTTDQEGGGYAIALEMTREGGIKFEEATRLAISGQVQSMYPGVDPRAIVILLDGEVVSSPVPKEVISGGNAVITKGVMGGFDLEYASNTAALIRGGALPVGLTEVTSSVQTAKIGINALENSVIAGFFDYGCLLPSDGNRRQLGSSALCGSNPMDYGGHGSGINTSGNRRHHTVGGHGSRCQRGNIFKNPRGNHEWKDHSCCYANGI
jgi:SecD/SecF fusion protein